MIWHSSPVEDVIEKLGTSVETGLFNEQISAGIQKYGKNTLSEEKKQNFFLILLNQFKDLTVIILIIAALLSLFVSLSNPDKSGLDFILIILIVIFNAFMGAFQQYRTEAALDSLKKLSPVHAKVLRNGKIEEIYAQDVIPGDIIFLEKGSFIPADARLIECDGIRCNESPLTGESVSSEKNINIPLNNLTPLADRTNMVYSGCTVSEGSAKAVVVATGMHTEMGKIAGIIDGTEKQNTSLQNKIKQLGKMLAYFIIPICVLIFIFGVIFSKEIMLIDRFMNAFITAISLAVAAIPEGLTAIVTLILVFGVKQMVKKNIVVKNLPTIETLGNVSVICTDKTGTLTQNKMTAVKIFDGKEIVNISKDTITPRQKNTLMMAALCCDGRVDVVNGKEVLIGDHTEAGIVSAAVNCTDADKATLDDLYPRVSEIPFTSERKLKTSINIIDGRPIAIVKGSPDIIIDKCVNIDREGVLSAAEKMAAGAMRVIAIAFKALDSEPTIPVAEELECNLNFAGLIGLTDPPRPEAAEALEKCRKAGIRVVMITGDQVATAVSVAKNIGISNDTTETLTGEELAQMSDEELLDKIETVTVYARVSPEEKIRIIEAWQKKGNVVVMTGDGVNDAPALKTADIGCAMGITGTDVAVESADMTLSDDNFATIVKAIETGRALYENIRKAVQHLLACNLGEVLTVLLSIFIWKNSPVLAVHLLWVNFIIDILPAFAIGNGKPTKDLMNLPPRKNNDTFFSGSFSFVIAVQGILYTMVTMIAYGIGGESEGTTMAFAVLAFSHIFGAFAMSSRLPIWDVKRYKSNPWLFVAMLISVILMLCVLLFNGLHTLLNLSEMNSNNWISIIYLSLIPTILIEIGKVFYLFFSKKKGK